MKTKPQEGKGKIAETDVIERFLGKWTENITDHHNKSNWNVVIIVRHWTKHFGCHLFFSYTNSCHKWDYPCFTHRRLAQPVHDEVEIQTQVWLAPSLQGLTMTQYLRGSPSGPRGKAGEVGTTASHFLLSICLTWHVKLNDIGLERKIFLDFQECLP